MALPAIALALPFAGHGAVCLARGPRRGRGFAVLFAVAALYAVNLRAAASLAPLEPSSHYRNLVAGLDPWYGTRTPVSDCVELRARQGGRAPAAVLVELRGGYRLRSAEATEVRWQPRQRPRLRLRLLATRPRERLEVALRPERPGARAAILHPIVPDAPDAPESWAAWRPAGLRGVEVRWCGGGRG